MYFAVGTSQRRFAEIEDNIWLMTVQHRKNLAYFAAHGGEFGWRALEDDGPWPMTWTRAFAGWLHRRTSITTRPRDSTVSVAPVTSRPSYGL